MLQFHVVEAFGSIVAAAIQNNHNIAQTVFTLTVKFKFH
jgi:hypothetical protein